MTSREPAQEGIRGLLRAGSYRTLLVGQAVSSLGSWVGTFALMARAFDLTGSPTAVGGVLVLRLVPPIFASPVGGVLADRVDRRTLLVASNVALAGLIALVPFVGLTLLYVLAFVSESILLLSLPARDASIPQLVPRSLLPQANGLVMGSSYGMLPVGAALFSGLRLASEHVPAWFPWSGALRGNPVIIPFLFDAATFLFAASMFSRITIRQAPAPEALPMFAGLRETFGYARSSRPIRGLAAGVGVAMFGGGVLFALGIGYVRETLDAGDVEFGFLTSLWGLGMALGLGTVRLLVHRGEPVVFRSAVMASGAILVSMAFLPYVWLALLAALVFGMAFSVAVMLAITLVQRIAEDRMLGRLLGAAQMLFRVSLAVGALGIGGAAGALRELSFPVGPFRFQIDGNQFGMVIGGVLILAGAAASRGVVEAGSSTGE